MISKTCGVIFKAEAQLIASKAQKARSQAFGFPTSSEDLGHWKLKATYVSQAKGNASMIPIDQRVGSKNQGKLDRKPRLFIYLVIFLTISSLSKKVIGALTTRGWQHHQFKLGTSNLSPNPKDNMIVKLDNQNSPKTGHHTSTRDSTNQPINPKNFKKSKKNLQKELREYQLFPPPSMPWVVEIGRPSDERSATLADLHSSAVVADPATRLEGPPRGPSS